jgi:hypothetical protein
MAAGLLFVTKVLQETKIEYYEVKKAPFGKGAVACWRLRNCINCPSDSEFPFLHCIRPETKIENVKEKL